MGSGFHQGRRRETARGDFPGTLRWGRDGGDGGERNVGPKPGEGEIVDVPWAEVAKVSNGLTYAKALDEWKAANAGNLCETCQGYRTVKCADCHGTSHDHASSRGCTKCKGEGEIKCAQPRCKEGKVPCPGKCLKLTEGTWVKRDDGKRWRTIKLKGRTVNISEGHIGEVWEVGNDEVVNRGKCPTCAGTAEVICPKCEGTSASPCPTCLAAKDAPDCPTYTAGRSECAICVGSGLKPQQ